MDNPTNDLGNFGQREIRIAAKLLTLYAENKSLDFLGDGVQVWFNYESGIVFLSDEDYNVGVLNSDETKVVQFFYCPDCGVEGTIEEYPDFEKYGGYCSKKCSDGGK